MSIAPHGPKPAMREEEFAARLARLSDKGFERFLLMISQEVQQFQERQIQP